ncbi:hypothetical protein WICPIJ_007907 [Wickerhamomyces pijperi]|uniref:DNA replication licensing factor MCM4 n=1 Tax=Wickerhamomyces pijperi TaxID=599730 RepID=A0A9P8Q0T2_WICPI|nr:hypothetical protein WICPIJ_007907 [Wickerhamomyces pijperi]
MSSPLNYDLSSDGPEGGNNNNNNNNRTNSSQIPSSVGGTPLPAAEGPFFGSPGDTTPSRNTYATSEGYSNMDITASSPLGPFHGSQGGGSSVGTGGGASSPLHYSSSQFGSEPNHRGSDLGSELRSDNARRRKNQEGRANRGDINSSDLGPRRRLFNPSSGASTPAGQGSSGIPSSDIDGGEGGEGDDDDDLNPKQVIWGTDVNITTCSKAFRNFLMHFKMKYRRNYDGELEQLDDDEYYYVDLMKDMIDTNTTNLNLDARNLLAYEPSRDLYRLLQMYPSEIIPIMDQVTKECILQIAEDEGMRGAVIDAIDVAVYKIRPYNPKIQKDMRQLDIEDIDKLVGVKGIVLRVTNIIPEMRTAFFKCSVCDHQVTVDIDRGIIHEPTVCPRPACAQPNTMVLIHNRCTFADRQIVKFQETPDMVPDGQTPHSVALSLHDELVDCVRPGDKIEVTGLYRSTPVRVNAVQRTQKALFKTHLDVVHVKKTDAKRLNVEVETNEEVEAQRNQEVEEVRHITEQEIQKIHETSERPDLYDLLSRSVAPSIFELDDVKKGILLQLFGGTSKTLQKGGRYRGDINVLLCGDPSTSKSQLLQYVHKIAPRGIYTSGKGSSAVGLTAYVTRDIETKQLVLESGALVLSDGGICCIDEFDKMSDMTRSVLHEAMEQQTISIAKAGIITTLNARTSILASANPINSRYDVNLPVTKNIDLPPPLLSRFDLVYLILDKVDEAADAHLGQHMLKMYASDTPQNVSATEILPIEFLTTYISYAKSKIQPKLTQEAKEELVKSYVDMRKLGDDSKADNRRITATTRQLESMIRLSEAHAKMRLSAEVELDDVREAVRLMRSAIKDYATDPITGKIDMDLVQTGHSASERRINDDFHASVKKFIEENVPVSMPFPTFMNDFNAQSQVRIESRELSDALDAIQKDGLIDVKGEGVRKIIYRSR